MKTPLLFIILLLGIGMNNTSKGQTPTTAYDFNMSDCNGNMHHLFSELDSGHAVVLEFFMLSCNPCITAGKSLDAMFIPLKKKYGEKVRFYQFGFTKNYTCTQIKSWVSTNGFANSVPFDSGDVQVAYYGGMGMPTVVTVAGKGHDVLFSSMEYKPDTDTTLISTAIHNFFDPTGILTNEDIAASVFIYPNPASTSFLLNLKVEKQGTLNLSIFDLQGQKVVEIPSENIKPGYWNKTIALPSLSPGTYFLNGKIGTQSFTKKVTIVND
ncbi:MAG TPA: T9SS type A sorting domain-containing protein [Bacteroidia bacterium]|jgi:thiol-disulfide isomerase/thioredoxin|nr:T9SS type A sorting domain-containing protein [Bacteroidia bacterium]